MATFTQKQVGIILIGLAVILAVILGFVKSGIDERDAYLCEVTHENPNADMKECPAHTTNTSWLIIAAFGLAFLLLASGLYLVMAGHKKQQPAEEGMQFKEVDISKLDEEEQKVYTLLKDNKGSMYQSDIIKATGFSKVHVTRILDKMSMSGIVDRKRRGMTNIVVLK